MMIGLELIFSSVYIPGCDVYFVVFETVYVMYASPEPSLVS